MRASRLAILRHIRIPAALPRFALRPTALSGGHYERFAKFLADRGLIKAPRAVRTYAVDLAR